MMCAILRFCLFFLLVHLLPSCVFISQIKERRSYRDTVSGKTVNDQQKKSGNIDEIQNIKPATGTNQPGMIADTGGYIWYHPNPWWKIKTDPFPVASDSFEYRMMRPQYGFPDFIHPNLSKDKQMWERWMTANKIYDERYFGGHLWQGIIQNKKDYLIQHPEYLAEINGNRVGFGKTNKFCVSHPGTADLMYDALISILEKRPDSKFLSVEPSDGAGFCQCEGCRKLGSISNQVFYLANEVAKKFEKTHPSLLLNVYAYYLHSDTPSFKLNKNIVVAVIPGGFQTIYPQNTMLTIWARHHRLLYWRDYFGIPQWTSDLPRIDVEQFLTRTEIARNEGYRAIIMESGMNLNAAILFVLFNAKWMNDSLAWNDIFNKFISDCFPESASPMKRLFTRWHNVWLKGNEFAYAAYDLNEALQRVKDPLELERIVDVIAYTRMMYLLYQWLDNRSDTEKLEQYLRYIYRLSTRNLIQPRAIISAYQQHFPNDSLKNKHSYENFKNQTFPYLSKEEVLADFRSDLSKISPRLNDFIPLEMKRLHILPIDTHFYTTTWTENIKGRSGMHLITDRDFTLHVTLDLKNSADTAAHITVCNYNNSIHFTRILRSGDVMNITNRSREAFYIQVDRVRQAQVMIRGRFIPILSYLPDKLPAGVRAFSYYNGWKALEKSETIENTHPYYFMFRN